MKIWMDDAQIITWTHDRRRKMRTFWCCHIHSKLDCWLRHELPWVIVSQLFVRKGSCYMSVINGVDVQHHMLSVFINVHKVIKPERISCGTLDKFTRCFLEDPNQVVLFRMILHGF